ncbi:Serine/threonine-protein phosphatase 4 regulatory subunit 2-B-like protein [Drosera capensis]
MPSEIYTRNTWLKRRAQVHSGDDCRSSDRTGRGGGGGGGAVQSPLIHSFSAIPSSFIKSPALSLTDTDSIRFSCSPSLLHLLNSSSLFLAAESKNTFSSDEVTSVLGIIASTGKFWNEWDELKSMLSFQLKQVLQEYPEAKKIEKEPIASLEESYADLANRLDKVLQSFSEGPPFTLQRLCEILLDAQGVYPTLSKLALALEKNLSVTSTLTKSSDPYPPSSIEQSEPLKEAAEAALPVHANSMENGDEPSVEAKDDIMADAEETTAEDMTIDVEPLVEVALSSEEVPEQTPDSSDS